MKSILLRFIVQLLVFTSRSLIRFAQALLPPQVILFDHIGGVGNTQLIGIAARLKIADVLDQKAMTAEELSFAIKTHPDSTHRMMRALATLGVFRMSRRGVFSNNRLSRVLKSDVAGSMKEFADYFGSDSNIQAWANVLHTWKTGENAFEKTHGMSIWEWFRQNPEEGQTFAAAMANLTRIDAPFIAQAYPFFRLQKLCDVAGGQGTLLKEILRVHPHLQAVLFDQTQVLEHFQKHPRIETQAGSFFETLPQGCDAYLLKDILHDWDDARCLKILEQVRKACSKDTRLLIVEVLQEKNLPEKPVSLMDAHMLTVCSGGRQRSGEELKALFEKSGFRMKRIYRTPLPVCIVEGVACAP